MRYPAGVCAFLTVFILGIEGNIFNVTVPSFKDVLSAYNNTPSLNITLRCLDQLQYLSKHPDVATIMIDAWSKLRTGALVSSALDLGNFDECMTIDEIDETGGRLLGKYCTLAYVLPVNLTEEIGKMVYLVQSICIPDACTGYDIKGTIGLSIPENHCTLKTDNTILDTGAILSVAVFISVGLLIFLSTFYDSFLYMSGKKSAHDAMIAFSLVSNGRKFFQTTKNPKTQILCFHGIKFISMMWIVAGHNAVGVKTMPIINAEVGQKWFDLRSTFYLNGAHLAVDSFFFISGFLVAYSFFKAEYKKSPVAQVASIPHMILHRYLRLTPSLLMLFLYATFLSRYAGHGPLFKYNVNGLTALCRKHWWPVFLYIQNYYNKDELCMTQLWYVSADMQIFVLAPLVYIPIAVLYKMKPLFGFLAMAVVNIFFAGLPIFIKLKARDFDHDLEELDTHSRIVDYFIGFMFGMFVRHNRQNFPKMSKIFNLVSWSVVLAAIASLACLYQESYISSYTRKAIGFSLVRVFWCISLCWLVYSCLNGQGGIVDWILSNRFMQVGGKLTYSMYLTHGSVLVPYLLVVRSTQYFSDYMVFYAFCGNLIVSILVGFVWTMAFELPMITVEKLIFGPRAKPKAPAPPIPEGPPQ